MNGTSTSSNSTSTSSNGQNGHGSNGHAATVPPGANRHGGAREGAGRKPKALAFADTAALVEEKIAAALPDITDALIEQAKKGDLGAARYLCDRILGRVAAVETAPAEDRRLPFNEEDVQIEEMQRESDRNLARLIAGHG